jgi:hypothetical protein
MYPFNHITEEEVTKRANELEVSYRVRDVLSRTEYIPVVRGPKLSLLEMAQVESQKKAKSKARPAPPKETTASSSMEQKAETKKGGEQKRATENDNESITFEALIFSLSFLRDNFHVDFRAKCFVDCMDAHGGEAIFLASTFNVHNMLSISMTEGNVDFLHQRLSKLEYLRPKIEAASGSLADLTPLDFDIFYLDCAPLQRSMLDEGVLINTFFNILRRVLPGSYAILLTKMREMDPEYDFDAKHIRKLTRTLMRKDALEESTCWVFMVIQPTPVNSPNNSPQRVKK